MLKNAHGPTPNKRLPVVDQRKVDPETLKAAQGLEAMFLDYMMQAMRKTVPKNEMNLENAATKIYRGMLDSEYAQTAAKQGQIGLADQIVAYLQADRYNEYREPEFHSGQKPSQRAKHSGNGGLP